MMSGRSHGSNPAVEFKCTACQQVFRRVEHLRRHLSTHIDSRPHTCTFCKAQYKRSDALRRHWKTCTIRLESGNAVPQRSLSGKRRQSCDCCATRKRACDQGRPCSECQTRGTECTYRRVGETFASQRVTTSRNSLYDPYLEGDVVGGRNFKHNNSETLSQSSTLPNRQRLDYLRNFTRAVGINRAYNYGRSFMSEVENPILTRPESGPSLEAALASNPWSYYLNEIEAELFTDHSNLALDNCLSQMSQSEPAFSMKVREVRDMILSAAGEKTGSTLTSKVNGFFTVENVARYIDLFWDRWYPHCPILHRPTFTINSCPALLMLTMSLIGACTSSSKQDRERACLLLDLAEEVLFSHSIFADETHSTRGIERDETKVSVLQAAYFMCILQKWEGNDAAKRRIQRSRFTTFVAATRSMGLFKGTHDHVEFDSDFGIDNWLSYIRREEMIRTFTFVFLLDSAFVIFHNSVPRMVLQEMIIDIPCPEEWFRASSPEEFLCLANSCPKITHSPTLLGESVRQLCKDSPDFDIVGYLGNSASKLGLFTIATAIHGLIFHQKMSYTPLPFAKTLLSKALDRWTAAWQLNIERLGSPDPYLPLWKEDGFIGHADDFAALAQIHLERANTSQEKWNELIRQLPGSARRSADGMATFDQTDMDQVANLIMAAELLNLDDGHRGQPSQ